MIDNQKLFNGDNLEVDRLNINNVEKKNIFDYKNKNEIENLSKYIVLKNKPTELLKNIDIILERIQFFKK